MPSLDQARRAEARRIRDAALALLEAEGLTLESAGLVEWQGRGLLLLHRSMLDNSRRNLQWMRQPHGIELEGLTEALTIRDTEANQPVLVVAWDRDQDRLEVLRFTRGAWQDRI